MITQNLSTIEQCAIIRDVTFLGKTNLENFFNTLKDSSR
jgi:hypothetical protein